MNIDILTKFFSDPFLYLGDCDLHEDERPILQLLSEPSMLEEYSTHIDERYVTVDLSVIYTGITDTALSYTGPTNTYLLDARLMIKLVDLRFTRPVNFGVQDRTPMAYTKITGNFQLKFDGHKAYHSFIDRFKMLNV